MKTSVVAVLAVALVAVLYLLFARKTDSEAIEYLPMPPKVANSQAMPAVSDMSLPMPLGLKGDPEKGRIFFMGNCFTCHGVEGDGNGPRAYFITPPPRDFLLESSRKRLNRPVLFEAITNGRVGTNMPAWGKVLNNQEIADVAEFVFENFIHPAGESGTGNK